MTQDLSLNDFKWVEETSVFNEDFIKTIMMKVMKDIFLHVQLPENLLIFHNDLSFLPERMKIETLKKLVANLN